MIIRVEKSERYVAIDKTPLEDGRISYKAKGILAYLLSKPNNWRPMVEELVKASKDKEESVRSGLKELEQCGYFVKKRLHGSDGKIIGWEHVVYEIPQQPDTEKPDVENPELAKPEQEKPDVEKPRVENPGLMNNEVMTNESNKDISCANAAAVNVQTGAHCPKGSGNGSSTDDYSSDFLAFWSYYPRKKEKAKAWRCWKARLKEKVVSADMLIAAQRYADECRGQEQKYIKLAATFLGPDRPYLDYCGGDEDGTNQAIAQTSVPAKPKYDGFFL